MKFEKLRLLISDFDNNDMSAFESLPLSPYSKCRPQVKLLYRVLKESDALSISENSIATKLGIPAIRLNDIANKLLLVLETFLANVSAGRQVDGIERDVHLLKVYSDRELWKNQQFISFRLEKSLENTSLLFSKDFLTAYEYHQQIAIQLKYKDPKRSQEHLEKMATYLDLFYLYERLKNRIEERFRAHTISATQFTSDTIDALLTSIDNRVETPATITFLIKLNDLAEHNFSSLETKYAALSNYFNEIVVAKKSYNDEMRTFAEFMMNICIKGINENNKAFEVEYLNLIKRLREENLLLDYGVLSDRVLKNIATIGIRLKEYDWVDEFIEEYYSVIGPQLGVFFKDYVGSLISFKKGEFETAIRAFPSLAIPIQDKYLYLATHKLWIQLLFETNADDHLLIESLAKFKYHLRSPRLNNIHVSKYSAFIKCCRQMVKSKRIDLSDPALDSGDSVWITHIQKKRKGE